MLIKISGVLGANLRKAPIIDPNNIITEIPYNTLSIPVIMELDQWYEVSWSGYTGFVSKKVAIPYIPPGQPLEYLPYYGQWQSDATTRVNDCGPTCVKMLASRYGIVPTVDSIREPDPSGLSSADNLVDNLKSLGLPGLWQFVESGEELPPFSICLVNYSGFERSSVWDKGFKGLHWLVHIEKAKVNGQIWHVCHDPDFAYEYLLWGRNHLYSEAEWKAAFVPCGNNAKRQIVYVK